MEIIDISLEIKEGMVRYPGNPAPSISRYASIPERHTNESLITLGSHAGTHVDAPLHIINDDQAADELPLDSFYGQCRVFDLTGVGKEIHRSHLTGFAVRENEIILLKTENSLNQYETFREDFAHVNLDAAEYLVDRRVKTLGVDYLSVKKFGGDQEVHEVLIRNLTLFEGLYLADVEPGTYIFVGLPLRIKCDGAPARAILIR